jgi:hypothetical protein
VASPELKLATIDPEELLDLWLDEYFLLHYPKSCSIERADQVVHHLVNTLLLMGEEGSNHKKL